jgi:ATP-binding cassette subfamily C protein CydD
MSRPCAPASRDDGAAPVSRTASARSATAEPGAPTGPAPRDALVLAAGARRTRIFSARLARLALAEPRALAATIMLGLAIAATYVGQALLIAAVLTRVLAGAAAGSVLRQILAAAGLLLVRSVLVALREGAAAAAAVRVVAALRQRLYARLLALGPGWLSRTRTGVVQATLVDGVESLDAYFRLFLSQAVVSGITAAAVIGYVFSIDLAVGAVVLASALVIVFAPAGMYRIMGRRLLFWQQSYRPLAAEYLDNLQGMNTLKAFGASRVRGAELAAKADAVCAGAIGLNDISSVQYGIMALAAATGSALSLGIGALRVHGGVLAAAGLLLILLLVRECFRPVAELQNALHFSLTGMYAGQSAFEILDAAEVVTQPAHPVLPARPSPRVCFEDVTFRYSPGDRLALTRLSFEVEPGETVALVGRSGAGKSTVVNLLLRFFDPGSGRITLAGADLRDLPLDWLRRQVAVVSQDTYLFAGSVADNLRLARPGASQADLEAAARTARAHDFIAALPGGYDTVVGERGMTLSGGERQRLSIARALLKDAPLLVLDEATSSVDVASEAAIQAGLEATAAGRTALVIAHRLSTVRHADRIVVLGRGRAVEAGDHDQLLRAGRSYARLIAAQAAPGSSPGAPAGGTAGPEAGR